jgi:hypothetical protein
MRTLAGTKNTTITMTGAMMPRSAMSKARRVSALEPDLQEGDRRPVNGETLGRDQANFINLWHEYGPEGLPAPVAGYHFATDIQRRWRFDVAWPPVRVALECEGGVFARKGSRRCPICGQVPSGGHTTGVGYTDDVEKYNAARERSWVVMQCTVPLYRKLPLVVLERMVHLVAARKRQLDRWHMMGEALKGMRDMAATIGDAEVKSQLELLLGNAQVSWMALLPVKALFPPEHWVRPDAPEEAVMP